MQMSLVAVVKHLLLVDCLAVELLHNQIRDLFLEEEQLHSLRLPEEASLDRAILEDSSSRTLEVSLVITKTNSLNNLNSKLVSKILVKIIKLQDRYLAEITQVLRQQIQVMDSSRIRIKVLDKVVYSVANKSRVLLILVSRIKDQLLEVSLVE